jgi:hypothetical protein
MHLVAQFGHIALMHTIFRIVAKTQTSKFLLMFDRSNPPHRFFSSACIWPVFDSRFVCFIQGRLDVLALRGLSRFAVL